MTTSYDEGPKARVIALREQLKALRPDRPPRPAADDSSPCSGWYVAEEICLEEAIGATSDAEFELWATMADACATAAEACEALQTTL
jgi:hypothetical protein